MVHNVIIAGDMRKKGRKRNQPNNNNDMEVESLSSSGVDDDEDNEAEESNEEDALEPEEIVPQDDTSVTSHNARPELFNNTWSVVPLYSLYVVLDTGQQIGPHREKQPRL
jgi:hypothetical protein